MPRLTRSLREPREPRAPRLPGRLPARDDRGTVIPLILGFALIALLVTLGVTVASIAFLAQRNLQGVCDGAALAASDSVDEGTVFGGGTVSDLPLSQAGVRSAVARYLAVNYQPGTQGTPDDLSAGADTDGRAVRVTCHSTRALPFGGLFGYPDGLPRTATSTAQAPLR